MSTSEEPQAANAPVARAYDPIAGVLSYLVPGLGQIYQGRVGKGLLFLVSLLGMFFYGMHLDDQKNVYIPNTVDTINPIRIVSQIAVALIWHQEPFPNITDGLRFAGQFGIGVAAWPAILQYNDKWPITDETNPWHNFERMPPEAEVGQLQANSDKHWDLGWVYTVIAGVLNILVIYDALAGPAFLASAPEPTAPRPLEEAAPV